MHELPDELAAALEREAGRARPDQLTADTARLIDRYRADTPATPGRPITAGPAEAVAYAAYRMPATYAAIRAALAQLPDTVPAPADHLDIAGGTGAALWAVADRWDGGGRQTVWEQSEAASSLGRRLAASSARASVRAAEWRPTVLADPIRLPDTELITVGYLLSELDPVLRQRVIEAAIEQTGRLLIIVEPGTKAGYRRILAAREQLITAGMEIVAPCPHQQTCPLQDQERDWCHFAARVGRSSTHRRIKGGDLGHEDEKFSYLVASKQPIARPAGRVLRHPQFPKGRVILQLCQGSGDAAPVTVAKRDTAYKQARKSAWGDPWPPLSG